jgi:signal transduction histidine kinase
MPESQAPFCDNRASPQSATFQAPGAGVRPDDRYGLYRQVAEQLPRGAVFVVDAELRYQLAAGASLDDAGFVPSDFEGRLLSEAIPKEDYPRYESDYRQLLGGGRFTREHEVNGLDFISHGVPLTDGAGRIHAAIVVSYDITERKCAERRLALLDGLADAIRQARAPADIETAAARVLEQYFGRVACVFMARADGSVRDAYAGLTEEVLHALETRVEPRVVYPDGGGTILACPFHTDGALAGVTVVSSALPQPWTEIDQGFVRAVSDRAWADMERLRLVAALREADRQKDRYLAVLAHELRNPLATMHNGLSLLKATGPAAAQERVLDLMERQAGHMGRLIEDVLDASYICHGHMSLRLERLSLPELVGAAVEAAQPAAQERRQRLVLDADAGPMAVEADPTRLAQAVANLISNAIKYSPHPGTVRIAVRREGGAVAVSVMDEGIGMSADTRQRLFELFVRGRDPAVASSGATGLGIGLWVAHRLVESHGGSICAASEGVGKGSRFTITLPLA